MQSQTDNILQIYNELKKKDTNKIEAFIEEFKAQNKSKKKLTHKTFFELKKVCNEDFDEFIANVELTKNEAIIIGRALMQTKLKNKQNIVDALCEYKHSNIIILTHFLTTNCKVDLTKVVEMLENNINETVDCLKLVLIIFRNYRQYFSAKMQEFVSQSTHPICNEIKNNL